MTETHTPDKEARSPIPGDRTKDEEIERMIRVDHAGEYGAVRIYEGQKAILGDAHPKSELITHMHEQEKEHLAKFNALITERGVRPTALTPLWHMAGFALGAGTALIGPKAAMACTEAVEEVIDEHYQEQRERLASAYPGEEPELEEIIEQFQAEEVEHKAIAQQHGAAEATGYPVLSAAIKTGCRMAIWLAKRI